VYTQVIGLEPDNVDAYRWRGESYRMQHEYDAAIKDCTQAIILNPNYEGAYGTRGMAYYGKDDTARAIQDLQIAINLDPDYQWAKDRLADLAVICENGGNVSANETEDDSAYDDEDEYESDDADVDDDINNFEIKHGKLKTYLVKSRQDFAIGSYEIGQHRPLKEKVFSTVVIPDGVTHIGEGVFYNCDWITEMVIPDSVVEIGESAFAHCTSLTDVEIPDGVVKIGKMAFSACVGLTNIIIPDSVREIGDGAFGWCKSLSDVVIPSGVKLNGRPFNPYWGGFTVRYTDGKELKLKIG
jgi:hypothetical protein